MSTPSDSPLESIRARIEQAAKDYCAAMRALCGDGAKFWPASGDQDVPEVNIAHCLGQQSKNSILNFNLGQY